MQENLIDVRTLREESAKVISGIDQNGVCLESQDRYLHGEKKFNATRNSRMLMIVFCFKLRFNCQRQVPGKHGVRTAYSAPHMKVCGLRTQESQDIILDGKIFYHPYSA